MRYISAGIIFVALAHQVGYAQTEPAWTAVSAPNFFDYSTVTQTSQAGSGPYNLLFPTNPAGAYDSLGCSWNTYAGTTSGNGANGQGNPTPPTIPYWYSGNTELSGGIVRYLAVGVAFVDPVAPGTQMKGLSFLGSVPSGTVTSGSNPAPAGAVYYTSEPCADGTTDYGFGLNWASAGQFYYQYWTNCGEGSLTCYENNGTTEVVQCSSGFTFPTLPASTNGQYYYNAFPFLNGSHWDFWVEVLDGGTYASLYSCDVNPASSSPFDCTMAGTASPPLYPNVNTKPDYSPCTVVPAGNTTVDYNPGWVYSTFGSIFVAISGGSPSQYVSVGGVPTTPMQISVIKAGK